MGRIHAARGLPLRTTPRALGPLFSTPMSTHAPNTGNRELHVTVTGDVHEQLQALAADKDAPAEDYAARMLTDDVISLLHLRRRSE
ncbi:hypothetical protein ACIF6I_33745 [Streptomyces microflavus]|uniref:hypothetical protein n=1 Tax=Streptomyces microflavus TaxID=1919 RepID=UPI0037CCCCA3